MSEARRIIQRPLSLSLSLFNSNFWSFFGADNNEFEGEIPYNYLVDLPTIKEIDLSNNLFSGLVQDEMRELWGMQNLERLNLCKSSELGIPVPLFISSSFILFHSKQQVAR